jgi:hypothetical protein
MKEDIIRMAREAGWHVQGNRVFSPVIEGTDILWLLERFAALVRADEREAVCRIVTGLCISDNNAEEINRAIRARGQE